MSSIFNFIATIFQLALFLAIVIAVIALFGYNKLRALSEGVKEAGSNIGVTARKQVSLVNQLIDAVKGYQESEKLVMLKVSDDLSLSNFSQVHQQSGMVLSAVASMAQRFPDLKSSEQYNRLMDSIQTVENQLEAQRARYNSAAKIYNVQRTSIPHVFYSKLIGFNAASYLDFDSAEPQDMGMLKTITSDDGERLNALLFSAGSKVMTISREIGSKAVEQSKNLIENAQEKMKQLKVSEFHYLDVDRKPKGPITFEQMNELFTKGEICHETPILQNGDRQWKSYKDIASDVQ